MKLVHWKKDINFCYFLMRWLWLVDSHRAANIWKCAGMLVIPHASLELLNIIRSVLPWGKGKKNYSELHGYLGIYQFTTISDTVLKVFFAVWYLFTSSHHWYRNETNKALEWYVFQDLELMMLGLESKPYYFQDYFVSVSVLEFQLLLKTLFLYRGKNY